MIKATKYEVEDLGRYFKTSKKKYKWYFQLETKDHFLELEFSYLSGKRKLQLDGRSLHESTMLTSSFQYPFTLEGFALNVIQQGDSFELRINNKVFSHLYTQQKTQNEFVFDDKVNTQEDQQGWGQNKAIGNEFSDFGAFSQQSSNKFSLNLKLDKKEEDTTTYFQKTKTPPQPAQTQQFSGFSNPKFEDFESFGQFGQKGNANQSKNPFGEFSNFSDFSGPGNANVPVASKASNNAKVDLLDLDDTPNPPPQQQQAPQQQASPNLFQTDFAFTPQANPNVPVQQTQPVQAQQPNLFDAFSTQAPQQQVQQAPPQPNILNLYGAQPPINPNLPLAYTNFPQMQPQVQPQQFAMQPQYPMQVAPVNAYPPNQYGQQGFIQPPMQYQPLQPVPQQAPTQFDMFK